MKTTLRLLLCAGFLAVPGALALWATDPTPTTGKVLILENERLLEGDVDRIGDRYRVRRRVGETWVPADRVVCLCASLEDAYTFLRGRANLQDADERLRLAQWCHVHGLREQALLEVKAAVELRPEHAASRRLLANLEQAAATAPSTRSPSDNDADPEPPPTDISADAVCLFSTRVQPVLMNACAGCHATGHGGAFKLTRIYDERSLNRKTVQRNLAAVLTQLNARTPLGSPLLTKSLSVHDGKMVQAPFQNRQAPAYRILEDWVQQTVESNPQLHVQAAAEATAPPPGRPVSEPAPVRRETAPTAEVPAAPPPVVSRTAEPATVRPAAPAAPQPMTPFAAAKPTEPAPAGPVDEFDPLPFNRQMHPERP